MKILEENKKWNKYFLFNIDFASFSIFAADQFVHSESGTFEKKFHLWSERCKEKTYQVGKSIKKLEKNINELKAKYKKIFEVRFSIRLVGSYN